MDRHRSWLNEKLSSRLSGKHQLSISNIDMGLKFFPIAVPVTTISLTGWAKIR